jgi:serine/threonine protein kinase
MEYCERGSLEKIEGSNFKADIAKSVAILEPICDALAAAHAQRIIHRDVKPSNIPQRADGTPVIADFGICHLDGDEYVTLHEEAMGALNYIAPEMESGRRHLGEPSEKTDIYPLGKVLYWMLSDGSIFAREDHRTNSNSLTALLGDQRWEHVHMLLDKVLVEKPSDRLDTKKFVNELHKVSSLVVGNFAPLKPSIGIKCRFCGIGVYQPAGREVTDKVVILRSNAPGITSQVVSVNVMSCNNCGHVELFDFQRTGSWWTP